MYNETEKKQRRILSKMQTYCTVMEIRLNIASCQLAIIICHYIISKTIINKVPVLKRKIVSSYIIMFSNFCNITALNKLLSMRYILFINDILCMSIIKDIKVNTFVNHKLWLKYITNLDIFRVVLE